MLATKENHTWMIKEKVEALETLELVDEEPTKTTRVGTTMITDMKKKRSEEHTSELQSP